MAIMQSNLDEKQCLTITIRGRFDYHTVAKFRYHIENQSNLPKRFVIDLTETQMIDSTAIGMLLQLKKEAGEEREISLKHPNEMIVKILKISQIDRLFSIDEL